MSMLTEQPAADRLTQRERELGGIIDAYNDVTERLKQSQERLRTEVVRLREELARKNRQLQRRERLAALGEMAAGVAHEIRNPLGGIQLFAALLEKDLRHRPDQHRLAVKIAKGVGNVEAIMTDFLEFGRPRDPELAPVKVGAVVREAVELAMSKAAEHRVDFEVCQDEGITEILSDAGMIRRALLNLLLNAIDAVGPFGPDSGAAKRPVVRVTVSRAEPESVVLRVVDEGPGVPAELIDRIFNPFFTTKDRGTGLGLAIVHQTAESLGGHVQAANGPNGGAVFSLCLPAVVPQGAASRREPADGDNRRAGRNHGG